MKQHVEKPLNRPRVEVDAADADGSESPVTPFSALESDSAKPYDPKQDDTGELEKVRIHDK